ncbi:MAG TPA: hypothetical protein VHT92_09175 [Candidatus Cybelea sp.]|jgi:hypothetical protein|nr:hypothetical protein [Candidatus Cybelea sp.]
MRTIALIAALAIAGAPAIVQADQSQDKTLCTAAMQIQNWSGIAASCRAVAEDYATNAQSDSGHQRALDLTLEGTWMAEVGLAYDNVGRYNDAASAKAAARFFLTDAQTQTDDPRLLDLIETSLSRL